MKGGNAQAFSNLYTSPNIQNQDDWDDLITEATDLTEKTKRKLPKSLLAKDSNRGYFKTQNTYNIFNNLIRPVDKIEDLLFYLNKTQIPSKYDTTTKQNKFIKDSSYFYSKDGKLFLKNWDLEVIPKNKISEILKKEYDYQDAGLGSSIVKFYKLIREKYPLLLSDAEITN